MTFESFLEAFVRYKFRRSSYFRKAYEALRDDEKSAVKEAWRICCKTEDA